MTVAQFARLLLRRAVLVGPLLFAATLATGQIPGARSSARPPEQAPPVAPEEAARIEGEVRSLEGQPLARVAMRLTAAPPKRIAFATETDDLGQFRFPLIPPGAYNLSAEKEGYLTANRLIGASGKRGPLDQLYLEVRTGDVYRDANFGLQPESVIAGEVRDADGHLIGQPRLTVLRKNYSNSGSFLRPINASATIGEDGRFTLRGLPPGRYYLRADVPAELAAGESDGLSYVPTFYPSTEFAAGALPLELTAEQDVQNAVITLRQSAVFEVSGLVIDPREERAASGEVALLSLDASDGTQRGVVALEAGHFRFQGVLPGRYLLQAYPVEGEGLAYFGQSEVLVTKQSEMEVEIRLQPAAQVSGTITLETAQDATRRPSPVDRVTLEPVGRPQAGTLSTTAQDGSFQISAVPPGLYRIGINARHYLKSVQLGSEEIGAGSFLASPGSTTSVSIVLSDKGGEIRGRVVQKTTGSKEGEPAVGVRVSAWLAGQAADGSADFVRVVLTGADGEFVLQNLPPGRFSVLAWEEIEPGLEGVPAFRTAFTSEDSTVEIADGARITFDPPLIPRERIDGEAAKLR